MTPGELLDLGATWLWLVALHSFLMGLVYFAWTRVESVAPGPSRRWMLSMILVLPLFTGSFAMVRRAGDPDSAWFDSSRLLNLPIAGGFDVSHVAITVGGLFVGLTLLQEIVPVFFPPVRSDHPVPALLDEVAREAGEWPGVEIIMIDDHLAAATGGTPAQPKLFLSATLAESFDRTEIEAIVRHEHAHLEPRRWWAVHLLFLVRLLQMANPVALWTWREYGVEVEIDCDRQAVRDDPRPLARVLFAIYEEVGRGDATRQQVLQRRIDLLLGRSRESHRTEQLPAAALLASGALIGILLLWVI